MLAEQVMVPSLRRKWHAMREDAKETLEVAFRDGVTNPILVPSHFFYIRRVLGYTIEFHHFRVGYATFVVALIGDYPEILLDIRLEDGLPLYPL